MTLCPGGSMPPDLPDAGESMCCIGAAMRGPSGCTCWVAVYDAEQQTPQRGLVQTTRARMCGDCAYRPGSPEKADDPRYRGDADELEHLAAAGTPFHCHQYLRRVVAWRHPAGVEVPAGPGAYDPPLLDGIAFRLDGTPEDLCAGWDARRRALAHEGAAT